MQSSNISNDRLKTIEQAAYEASKAAITGRARPFREIKLLHRNLKKIRKAYKKLIYSHELITPAYEWLYDNYYILEREGRQVIKELWKTSDLPMSGDKPVIKLHAEYICKSCAGSIDARAIEHYIEAAQKSRYFEISELSALVLMLRITLIEGAARACSEKISEDERKLLFSDAVKTLNFFATFDFAQIVERQSRLEQILSQDPAGVYPKMEERSRDLYRRRTAAIARRLGISETEAAQTAVELASRGKDPRTRHVGYYILEQNLDKPRKDGRGKTYLALLWALPAVVSIALGFCFRSWWLPILIYIPMWEIIRPVIDYFILKGVPATFLPRMDLEGVIPESAPTLVVVSTLLTSPQKAEDFAKKIEQFYYSNGRGNIMFGILGDLKESNLPDQPEDKAIREAAVKRVRALNRKYCNHFCLFVRSRRYSPTQDCFTGWERKRGAIIELVRFMKGQFCSITTFEGDIQRLRSTKYVITLDADTGLVMDAASEMVSVAMHPLNRPKIENGIVTEGYGILAPRISVNLESAAKTPFSRIMAGAGGVTAYDDISGDIYQDIFGESVFAGKGIIDVDAFYEILDHKLPENRILSHDILEGCYLRAGYLSDVELTDGFPPSPAPWFDRLHRWIRGDWQNIGFIFPRLPSGVENPFNTICRFRLFDNLRRSVTPIFAFLCLIVSAFMPLGLSILLIVVSFLSLSCAGLLSAAFAIARGGPSMLSRKYHCRVIPSVDDSLAQAALAYLFLPYHAYIAADAIVRALWRLRSGKNLLEWVTAAESESQKSVRHNAFLLSVNRFWPTLVIGAAFLMLAPQPAAKIAGAFFIITPFIAWLSGVPTPPLRDELSDEDVALLHSYTAAMWRFYEEYATSRENWLPPDNYQEAPVSVIAHRTSPTNIGLMLLSTLAARDLKLIDTETLFERVEHTVSTIEKMEKWKGHLYNWYNTKTLEPLRPAYVSTVDSGNLLCCLVALRQGLLEYAHEYVDVKPLLDRITKIMDDTDLGALYNKHRRLFHIGYDVEKGELSHIYYDLLMSEARMTSYYAIAKRIAPKRHWGALGRTLTSQNGYTGPISWTGTMFEYFMPHLLLPVYEDSMTAEALRFVIYCQKRRVRDRGIPWGISESGFYSFDAALNYQYTANGVQKLALKRGMDKDLVISPYSTFLALPFDRSGGMKNLRRLQSMGMYGHCGFFEAADFSYKRTGGRMAIVKSYMAHHVGMSIIAADNALFDGIMQERFMRDHEMRAAQDLLCEKIPADAVVFNDVLRREVPEKPGRYFTEREEFDVITPVAPRVNIISNGEYTTVLTDCGASLSIFRGIDITRRSADILRAPSGIFAAALFGDEPLSVTAAPEYAYSRLVRRRVEFNSHGAVYHARNQNYGINMQACLCENTPCEIRCVELENYSQKRVNTKLLFYLEPALAKAQDEAAHPAFSHLFLSVEYRQDTKLLIFTRRTRNSELPASIAVGFAELDADFEFEGDRPLILTRPFGTASLTSAISAPFNNRTGALPDAAAAIRVKTELAPRGKRTYTLLIAAASTPEEASARLIETRRHGLHSIMRSLAGRDEGEMESRLAALVLPQLLFPVNDYTGADGAFRDEQTNEYTIDRATAAAKNRLGQSGLWQLGISGDLPIVLFNYEAASDLEHLEPYIKMHRMLRLRGIQFDLVITYNEGGDYARSKFCSVNSCVRGCGCEYLCGSRGGIHIVNLALFPGEVKELLVSCACHIASGTLKRVPRTPYYAAPLHACTPLEPTVPQLPSFGGGFNEGEFVINHLGENPAVPWCHIISSRTFGTLVSDRGLGFTWALNARENKLTPWNNDSAADNRGEMIIVRFGTHLFDVCLNAKVTFSPGSAVYESEAEGIKFRVGVTILERFMVKLVTLEIENGRDRDIDIEAAYYTEPVLGVSPETRRHIAINKTDDAAFLRNPWSQISGCSFLTTIEGKNSYVFNRSNFLCGKWEKDKDDFTPDPCAAVIVKRHLPPKRREKIRFILGFAGDEKAAEKTVSILKEDPSKLEHKAQPRCTIRVKTPDKRLNELVNTWLHNQFICSRIKGRTGFYQCSGAYGFRDQLQDCCAAVITDPQIAKSHIYRCAAHQFKEGDVMHWWHQLPPRDGGSRGVRTRCSDDLLWLPYTVCEYLEKTGDYSIFNHDVYYLDGEELDRTEDDRYFVPPRSAEKESVYNHCVRAINRSLTRGPHGLPLFGSGDWNDGMNLVGADGKGESVWLAMFEILVLERFIPVARHMGDEENAKRFEEEARRLRQAVDEVCWDGKWYARGFYDDGSPLGSKDCSECRIDILPQSFATIADLGDKERRETALDSMVELLVDERLRLVRLFDPAFDKGGGHNPGYIRSYPPGIRENGGQYTHAAVWAALALLIDGRADEGYKILSWINPACRTQDAESARTYRLEPYVIAADIYTNPACEGRGGWSLYTGAAGWYYRTVVEYLLGIKIFADKIVLSPRLPSSWPGFEATIDRNGTHIEIKVAVSHGEGLTVDGVKAEFIPLDGKAHKAELKL